MGTALSFWKKNVPNGFLPNKNYFWISIFMLYVIIEEYNLKQFRKYY